MSPRYTILFLKCLMMVATWASKQLLKCFEISASVVCPLRTVCEKQAIKFGRFMSTHVISKLRPEMLQTADIAIRASVLSYLLTHATDYLDASSPPRLGLALIALELKVLHFFLFSTRVRCAICVNSMMDPSIRWLCTFLLIIGKSKICSHNIEQHSFFSAEQIFPFEPNSRIGSSEQRAHTSIAVIQQSLVVLEISFLL